MGRVDAGRACASGADAGNGVGTGRAAGWAAIIGAAGLAAIVGADADGANEGGAGAEGADAGEGRAGVGGVGMGVESLRPSTILLSAGVINGSIGFDTNGPCDGFFAGLSGSSSGHGVSSSTGEAKALAIGYPWSIRM